MAGSQQGWRVAKSNSGGGVQSVTGLNTDNTDPTNPIVEISVDGTTITGDGTPASPLQANFTNPRVQSVVSSASVTPTATNDEVVITALATGLTLINPSGSVVQGQSIMIRIKDNGTPQTIAYDTQYRAIGVTLPTTTTANKTLYIGMIYNQTDTKWDVLGINQEA
jgi:hypothetical protein